jgi:hypothetical protein
MIRNEAYNFFLHHVQNENLDGKTISSMRFIDEVFRPNFHSECDQEKNYKLHFLNNVTHVIFKMMANSLFTINSNCDLFIYLS